MSTRRGSPKARVSGSNPSASPSDRNSLSSQPSGSPAAARVLSGSVGANSASSAAISALGRVTIAASASTIPRVVSMRIRRPPWSMRVTALSNATVESGAVSGDCRAVAFGDAPVDAVVGVAAEIARRDARQFRAAVIAADRVEQSRSTARPARASPPAARSGSPSGSASARSCSAHNAARIASASVAVRPGCDVARAHGGGVWSIVRPCASAIAVHGLRLAECSQPQPRSIAKPPASTVQARPPSRSRASRMSALTPASRSRRAAPIPAAPPPITATSTSPLAMHSPGRRGP